MSRVTPRAPVKQSRVTPQAQVIFPTSGKSRKITGKAAVWNYCSIAVVRLWWRNFGPVFLSPARVLSRRIFRFLSRSQSTRLITCACVRRIFLPGPFCCEHEREACLTLWMNQTSLDQVVYTRGQQRRVVNCAAFRRDWRKKKDSWPNSSVWVTLPEKLNYKKSCNKKSLTPQIGKERSIRQE